MHGSHKLTCLINEKILIFVLRENTKNSVVYSTVRELPWTNDNDHNDKVTER